MKSFKAFIRSWYYFLKEEKWVARTFAVIVVLTALVVNDMAELCFSLEHDVFEYGAIQRHSLSFDIIAQKLHNRLEEEKSADQSVSGLIAFLGDEGLSYYCIYNNDNKNGETINLPLNPMEKQSAKNIDGIFDSKERYLYKIGVYEDKVVFCPMAYYNICWFPDKQSLKNRRLHMDENKYALRRVNPLFTKLYIFYYKNYGKTT